MSYFGKSLDDYLFTQTRSFGSGLEKLVYFTNRDFGELTRATKKLFRSLMRIGGYESVGSKNIFRIENFRAYLGISNDYVSGVVSDGGVLLTQSVIPLEKKNN